MNEPKQPIEVKELGEWIPNVVSDKVQAKRKKREDTVLDLMSGINMGVPPREKENAEGWDTLPNDPYTFKVKNLKIIRAGKEDIDIEDVNVLICHGWYPDGKWKFRNGNEVVTSVNEFNKKHPDKRIELITSCNERDYSKDDLRIVISEFQDVAHIVGSVVKTAYTYDYDTADIRMTVTVPEDGTDFGIEELGVSKKIKVIK